MVEVVRDLWMLFGLIPLPKQNHLELVAQDHVSKDVDFTTSLGSQF